MKAWELIDSPEKWHQGGAHRTDEKGVVVARCLISAIVEAYRGFDSNEMLAKVKAKLGIEYAVPWNDAPERKWEEVYGVLKELDI